MLILYTGPLAIGETCEMRRGALEALGHTTIPVDVSSPFRAAPALSRRVQWRLRAGPAIRTYNKTLEMAASRSPEAIWVDKGMFVRPGTLRSLRSKGLRWAVHYSPDNYFLAQNTSRYLKRTLSMYDVVVTTKPAIVEDLKHAGARSVLLSYNSYDPVTHHPLTLSSAERSKFGADVAFMGRWEPPREALLRRVASLGLDLAIWGPGWMASKDNRIRAAYRGNDAVGAAYAKAICGARIVLGLLSTVACDTITQRSVEIPACGAFMLAERTSEHIATFREGVEAEYFDGFSELAAKLQHYLTHDDQRREIASAGRRRCVFGGYSYSERLKVVLDSLPTTTA